MKKPKYQNCYLKQTFKLKTALNEKTEKQKTIQKIKKKNSKDALDVALADTQTVNYNDDTSLDDLQTVDHSNDTSVTDPVPEQKLKTIKEDENDDIEVIKILQRVVISNDDDDDKDDDDDDDDDVELLKQMPLHPRDWFSKN